MGKASATAELADIFAALADPTRLRLLHLMAGREVCVCYFVEILRQSQPKISRHLAYLRRAGLVQARRDGKWMHYRMAVPANEAGAAVLRTALEQMRTDRQMQADRAKLDRACCVPQGVDAAPLPVAIAD